MTSSVGSAASNEIRKEPSVRSRTGGSELGSMTFSAVGRAAGRPGDGTGGERARLLLIPLGATEQHGPHLPLATDTIIATAWATAAASRLDGAIVAPPLPYGSSGEHQRFPGTLSIGREALESLIIELTRSAAHFCDRVILVSGHGGNAPVLEVTVARLVDEGHHVDWVVPRWSSGTEVDAHAGKTETSLLLHLRPDLVGRHAGVSGNTAPLSQLMPELLSGGVDAVAPNGVLGDTFGASAEHGAELFQQLVTGLVERISAG